MFQFKKADPDKLLKDMYPGTLNVFYLISGIKTCNK